MFKSSAVSSIIRETENCNYKELIDAYSSLGIPLLFIKPNSKIPADIANVEERKFIYNEKLKSLKSRAKMQGWSDALLTENINKFTEYTKTGTGLNGIHLATSNREILLAQFERYMNKFNLSGPKDASLAMRLGSAPLVVVDCDTELEVSAFKNWYEKFLNKNNPEAVLPSPTVKTPGAKDKNGQVIHKNGGHWYLEISENILLDSLRIKSKIPISFPIIGNHSIISRFVIMCSYAYVLIPPSKRNNSNYYFTGDIYKADKEFENVIYEQSVQVRDNYRRAMLDDKFSGSKGIYESRRRRIHPTPSYKKLPEVGGFNDDYQENEIPLNTKDYDNNVHNEFYNFRVKEQVRRGDKTVLNVPQNSSSNGSTSNNFKYDLSKFNNVENSINQSTNYNDKTFSTTVSQTSQGRATGQEFVSIGENLPIYHNVGQPSDSFPQNGAAKTYTYVPSHAISDTNYSISNIENYGRETYEPYTYDDDNSALVQAYNHFEDTFPEWRPLMEEEGWIFAGIENSCGCEVYTAPGNHSSPRSAVAHRYSCATTQANNIAGKLHIFTDNPPVGFLPAMSNYTRNFDKFGFVVCSRFGGDTRLALKLLNFKSAKRGIPAPNVAKAFVFPSQPYNQSSTPSSTQPGVQQTNQISDQQPVGGVQQDIITQNKNYSVNYVNQHIQGNPQFNDYSENLNRYDKAVGYNFRPTVQYYNRSNYGQLNSDRQTGYEKQKDSEPDDNEDPHRDFEDIGDDNLQDKEGFHLPSDIEIPHYPGYVFVITESTQGYVLKTALDFQEIVEKPYSSENLYKNLADLRTYEEHILSDDSDNVVSLIEKLQINEDLYTHINPFIPGTNILKDFVTLDKELEHLKEKREAIKRINFLMNKLNNLSTRPILKEYWSDSIVGESSDNEDIQKDTHKFTKQTVSSPNKIGDVPFKNTNEFRPFGSFSHFENDKNTNNIEDDLIEDGLNEDDLIEDSLIEDDLNEDDLIEDSLIEDDLNGKSEQN